MFLRHGCQTKYMLAAQKMTRDELIAAIRDTHANGNWADFVATFRDADAPQHFATVFAHAIEQQAIGAAVYDAAKLLHDANLTCRISCEEAIIAMLPNWDVSIEEVPWYLKNQFGKDRVSEGVERVRKRVSSDQEQRKLDTIREIWSTEAPA